MHTNDKKIKFVCEGCLYYYTPTQKYLNAVAGIKGMNEEDAEILQQQSYVITSVTENSLGYTNRQFEQAKRARRLYHTVGAPTVENFRYMLRSNIIKDCPVTEKDARIAEKIFGPDVGTLKGKTTRRKPNVVKEDEIEVPPKLVAEPDDLVYCMDIFMSMAYQS